MSEEKNVETTVDVTEETKEEATVAAPVEEKAATGTGTAVKVSAFQSGKGFIRRNWKKILGGFALATGGLLTARALYKMAKGEPEVPAYEPMPMLETTPVVPAIADTVVDTVVPAVTDAIPAVAEAAETVTELPESLGIVD